MQLYSDFVNAVFCGYPRDPMNEQDTNTPAPNSAQPEVAAEAPTAPEPAAQPAAAVPDPRIAELESLVVHLKADFDNYKKRTQKELFASSRLGELEAVKRFLPAVSNLERALAAAQSSGESGALVDGLQQVLVQFQTILGAIGIERIPAVGLPFDPLLHDAVAAGSKPDVIPGTVIDEYEAGYRADGKALIPAKVRVATTE